MNITDLILNSIASVHASVTPQIPSPLWYSKTDGVMEQGAKSHTFGATTWNATRRWSECQLLFSSRKWVQSNLDILSGKKQSHFLRLCCLADSFFFSQILLPSPGFHMKPKLYQATYLFGECSLDLPSGVSCWTDSLWAEGCQQIVLSWTPPCRVALMYHCLNYRSNPRLMPDCQWFEVKYIKRRIVGLKATIYSPNQTFILKGRKKKKEKKREYETLIFQNNQNTKALASP